MWRVRVYDVEKYASDGSYAKKSIVNKCKKVYGWQKVCEKQKNAVHECKKVYQ